MKRFGSLSAAAITVLFLLSCGSSVLPENELKKLNPQKILDLAAEKYSNYDYEGAIYYYTSIGKIFPQDTDEVIDQKAWAVYEIGYIRYQQNRLADALKYFDLVIKIKARSTAPRILATEMRDKIINKK